MELSDTDRWASFDPARKGARTSDVQNLFSDKADGVREWIIVENSVFFCIYCLCFSRSEDKLSTDGIDFKQQSVRLAQSLTRHAASGTHALAKEVYENALIGRGNPVRESVKCITKCILFLATHSTFLIMAYLYCYKW